MNETGEKRRYRRYHLEAPVSFSYFNSARCHTAKTVNHSQGGIYLESDSPINPGAAIFVRLTNGIEDSSEKRFYGCNELRIASLGEVKWCQTLSDSDSCMYGIGIKYYDTPY